MTQNRTRLPKSAEQKLIASLDSVLGEVDALVIMDQVEEDDCGVVTSRLRARLVELANKHPEVICWADSRKRISAYSNVITKSNRSEAVAAAFPGCSDDVSEEPLVQAGRVLSQRSGRPVFITRAERETLVFDGESHTAVRGVHVDGPVDPTGAGDSATAAAVLTLASGGTLAEAA